MIKLGYFGAAGEVTGSCYVVSTERARVMVDMGMHQGEKEADEHNRRMPPVDLSKLDAVVLTHAHLDHCGRLPMLVKNGYRGRIHCTAPTANVSEIILRDSARLQAEDYERFMRRMRGKATDREPLYGEQDVERTIVRFSTLDYGELKTITDGITVKYVDAGHILGAASVQMTIEDAGRTVTIVFSGDIGQVGAPIVRDPITPTPADAVLIESTYGDRDHRSLAETCDEFLAILKQAQARGSKVIIPAFALGRAQDLIFHIGEFLRTGRLKSVNVYVDSPMAASISAHYARHTEFHDERASELARENMRPLQFPGLKYTQSVEESKRLNDATGSLVIIAANGMCTGGRVVHHLRHSLSNPNTHIVIVGYQGHGTLGRRLVDGAKFVSIFGDEMPVRAQVHTLGGFSAHAGQSGLLNWIAPFQELKPRVFLTHGEDGPRGVLRDQLQARFQLASTLPYYGDEVEI